MSRMFRLATLYQLIEKISNQLSTEQRKIVKKSFMSSYMRLWERAATFLIEYLEKSPEKPLSTITIIFPRLEFKLQVPSLPLLTFI